MQNTTSFKIRINAIVGLFSLTVLGNAHAGNLQGTYQKMLGLANSMQQDARSQGLSNTYAEKLSVNFMQLENNLKKGMGLSRNMHLSSKPDSMALLIEVAAVAASTGALHEFSADAQQNIAHEMERVSGTLGDDELEADVEDVLAAIEGRAPVQPHVTHARRVSQSGTGVYRQNIQRAPSPAQQTTARVQTTIYRPQALGPKPQAPTSPSSRTNTQIHQELTRRVSTGLLTQANKPPIVPSGQNATASRRLLGSSESDSLGTGQGTSGRWAAVPAGESLVTSLPSTSPTLLATEVNTSAGGSAAPSSVVTQVSPAKKSSQWSGLLTAVRTAKKKGSQKSTPGRETVPTPVAQDTQNTADPEIRSATSQEKESENAAIKAAFRAKVAATRAERAAADAKASSASPSSVPLATEDKPVIALPSASGKSKLFSAPEGVLEPAGNLAANFLTSSEVDRRGSGPVPVRRGKPEGK